MVLVTITASLGLGLAIIDVGAGLILDASARGDLRDLASSNDYDAILTEVQKQLLAIVLFGGAVLALIGTFLRAFSHNVSKRKNYDYAGKLFALGSLMFSLTGAMMAIDPDLRNMALATFVLLVVGTACAVVVIAALVIGEQEYRKSR